ncbi:SDR family NAD(P)-dependent oxidoreductase [Novosphingobium bradum]|uniref:SDR family NAD(P)-dependent oxidoreductase n=1 Tax=Novosphingobium bradum TaxID=1737444 RepID=A0ABV7IP25_9SPHN
MSDIEPGSVILVTGASGAIGFEIAAQAAERGAVVGVHGSSSASVAGAIERLAARVPGGRFLAAPADYAEPGAILAMVDKLAGEAGRLDAVIACAITGAPGTTGLFAGTQPEHYAGLLGAVAGNFQALCHAALPYLTRQGGTIVAFASDAGKFAAPRQSMIGSAYAAIMGFVRNLAMEVARDRVRVHCISPSFVADTPIFERFIQHGRAATAEKRAGLGLPTPRDIAPMVLFLCGRGAEKITGQVISINGGLNA